MNLDDIYQNQVKKNKISLLSTSFDAPSIERDPIIMNLEKNVFDQIRSIMPKESQTNNIKSQMVRTVSFEDAMKELLELSKK